MRPCMRTLPAQGARYLLGALVALTGCKGHPASVPALSKTGRRRRRARGARSPEPSGPKLVILRDRTPVMEGPSFGAHVLGEVRLGTVMARSATALSHAECNGGWYAVRPRGFVCAGALATLDMGAATYLPKAADLTHPSPTATVARARRRRPLSAKVPGAADQAAAEPDLAKYLSRIDPDKEVYGPSANDVPLDTRGVPTGPPLLSPTSDGVDASTKRSGASFFGFPAERGIAVFASFARESAAAPTEGAVRLRKTSGVAITASGSVEIGGKTRRFGLTPDGMIVPVDRLKPALGSTWHGIDLEKTGLPVAFVHKLGVHTWTLKKGDADKTDEELERRSAVPLTGKFRTIDNIRFEEAEEGYWVRAQDLTVVVKRSKFPEFAKGTQKWLDVSLANQTVTAYEGRKPIYATLISSGRDILGDPAQVAATPRGTFRVKSKHVTGALDPREVHQSFDVADAPWVLSLEGDFAITGTYWSEVGEAQNFHNITLSPIDARRLWTWADPQLPEGWHAAYDQSEAGTLVFVRP